MNLPTFYPFLIFLPYCTPLYERYSTTETYTPVQPHQERTGGGLCSLSPIGHQTYFGVNLVNIDQARRCCEIKNLTLLYLTSRWKTTRRDVLQNDLVRSTFIIYPIGPEGQIFVDLKGLSVPRCAGVYFVDPNKLLLTVGEADCAGPYNYLCEGNEEYPKCSEIEYSAVGPNKWFSKTKLPWREAFECCEERREHLISLHTPKIKEMPNIIKELEGEQYFWTGGHQKFGSFEWHWADKEPIEMEYQRHSEYCIVADASKPSNVQIKRYPCENAFHFVCEMRKSKNCDLREWEELAIDHKEVKKFIYSPNTFATFEDAINCCNSNDYTLFSSAVPSEGLILAEHFAKNDTLRYEFQGLASGLWMASRTLSSYWARMLKTRGHVDVPLKGNNPDHYLEGNEGCITFSLDYRNLFIYQDEECLLKRPFLCEMSTEDETNHLSFFDVGSRYFYSDSWYDHREANRSCTIRGMVLYTPEPSHDMKFVVSGVPQFFKWRNLYKKTDGFWVGYKRIPIPVYLGEQYIFRLKNDANNIEKFNSVNYRAKNENLCNIAIIQNGRVVMDRIACENKAHVLCEDTNITKVLGCSEFHDLEGLLFSYSPATWYDAKRCCGIQGNVSVFYDLINFRNASIFDDRGDYVMDSFQTFNHGFWTSGNNFGGRGKLGWKGGRYPLITESELFFQKYMKAYDILTESEQCLQAHYDVNRNKFQLSHTHCYNMKKYICMRTGVNPKRTFARHCENVAYFRFNESNYAVAIDYMPFLRAAECCQRRDAILINIHSEELNTHIYDLIIKERITKHSNEKHGAWIGLVRNPVTNQYLWIRDGTILRKGEDFSNFDNETEVIEKKYPDYLCVVVYAGKEPGAKKLFWRPMPCTELHPSLCFRRMRPNDSFVLNKPTVLLHNETNFMYGDKPELQEIDPYKVFLRHK